MVTINQAALEQQLEQAREEGEPGESLRIERVLDMVRQLHGARADCSSVNPPAFFVREVELGENGEVERCVAFHLPEMFGGELAPERGKLNAPAGTPNQMLHHKCPECGQGVPVVGEYYYDIRPHSGPIWMMFLYALCPHCPRLTELVEHESTQSFDERLR